MRKASRDANINFLAKLQTVACTKSMYFLVYDYLSAVELFIFTANLASRADKGAERAAKALLELAENETDRQRYLKTIEAVAENRGAFGNLRKFRATQSRYLLTTTVEAYNCYLSHIIQCVLSRNEMMLKSGDKVVSVEELLDFKTKKELVDYLIDRKLHDLAYGGIKGIEKYMSDVFGIAMFENDEQRDLFVVFSELRNVHVHNRGYINRLFLMRVKNVRGFKFEKNKRFVLDLDDIFALSKNLFTVAIRMDRLIARKYHLDRKRYSNWERSPPKFIS